MQQAGLAPYEIELYLTNIPNFDKMLPEDVMKIYDAMKENVILYLHRVGLSHREISRRLGGPNQSYTVTRILAKHKKEEPVTMDDVTVPNDGIGS